MNRINLQTIARLGGAWTSPKFEAGTLRATPVVKDGVMFVTAGASVHALNAKTGEALWQYGRPRTGGRQGGAPVQPAGAPAVPQGAPSKEGVALGEGLVFAGLADALVIALEEKTGQLAWSQYIGDTPAVRGQAAVGAPTYASGLVFIGLNADRGFRGPIPPGFQLGCFFAPTSFKTPNLLAPFFGMRVAPMADSQQTGYFYAVGNAWLRWRRRAEDPYFFSPDRRVPGVSDFAVLAAIDSRTNKIAWRHELRTGRLPGGAMPTAGGLMFQAAGDGNLQAYDAKSGEIVWQFQTGVSGGGPVMSYEVDGEQYVAFASTSVWAFKLGGALKPAATATPRPPDGLFAGPITDTNLIETASLARDMGLTGARQMTDEYTFGPARARVKAGTAVTWINNGTMVHTIVARDGSWTTGALNPIQAGVVTFDKPGSYVYTCKEHPWAAAELIVVE